MEKVFDDFMWHDGILVDIIFSMNNKGNSLVKITALFYKNNQERDRQLYQIICESVSRFNTSIDSLELKNNLCAGNISNGYLKKNILRLYLLDGMIEVYAKKFCLSDPISS